MSARPSYAEAWRLPRRSRPCGAGFVGAIAWTSTRSMEANYSTRGPKDGRRSRKGSHRRDGRSRRFQTVVGSTSHAPACLKCANNTAKICLSEIGQVGKMPEIFIGGSGGITDREIMYDDNQFYPLSFCLFSHGASGAAAGQECTNGPVW